MRAITKGPEPASLTAHRKTPHSGYDNYPDKDALRHALKTEQRGICCYCMGRIRSEPTRIKIEHWRSQRRFPNEQLDYRNLLGACLGGNGQPPRHQHCDTRKGDRDVVWNPADPAHHIETRLRYDADGTIRSDDPEFDRQLNDILNLNVSFLKRTRKGVLDAFVKWLESEKARARGPVPRDRLERQRARITDGAEELTPCCQVAVWWMDQRLARMAA